ncbi:SDR family oxidoreductase [candidate division KSB1 bacterium]|nr:SDR family oxidoreductase [candidate division KSB1 bacterium]
MFGLQGKVAAVVGGGGVLAGCMAEGLAKAGADIAILDLNLENAEKRAAQLKELGVRAIAIQMDASKKEDFERADAEIIEKLGRVDIVINAPGINAGTPVLDITGDEWDKIMSVNLKSMFFSSQVFGKRMIDQGQGGSFINISSASSKPPLSRTFTYGISKAGVNNLTQFFAREWAPHNIRVNAIAPGFYPAEQNKKLLTEDRIESIFRHTPMKRFGKAEELIGATIWLASSNASSFVTGAIIWVDGGFSAMTI